MTIKEEILTEVKEDLNIIFDEEVEAIANLEEKIEVFFKHSINFIESYCNREFSTDEELDHFPKKLIGVVEGLIMMKINTFLILGKDSERFGEFQVQYTSNDISKMQQYQLNKFKLV